MNAVYNQKKVVKVTYCHEDFFRIPTNVDLENKDQVEEWWVKWNTLYIKLKDIEEVVQIESEGLEQEMKYPDDQTIEDADDHFNWGDEDFVQVDLNTGKVEECFVCHKPFAETSNAHRSENRTRSPNQIGMCVGCEQYSRCDKGDCLCAGCEDRVLRILPAELMTHILSFRPRHPLAQIILDFKERAVAGAVTDDAPEEDIALFDESLHKIISYTQEGELFWKNTLGDGDPDLYCWRVRRDYDAVYNGNWDYCCSPWLGLYENPTQQTRGWNYSPEAYADPVQRKIEWAIFIRRKEGDAPK
jgi:hypothetical protein